MKPKTDRFDSPAWRFAVHGKKGGSSGDTQTVKQEPWGPAQPYLKQMMAQGAQLPIQQYYPFPTVSPLSQTTQRVANQYANYQTPQVAQDQLTGTARGDYLYGGPGFNRAVEAAVNRATPGIDSAFASLGRFGGGLHAGELQRTATDAFAGQYGNERKLQQAASLSLPQLAQSEIAARAQGGNIYDQFNQRKVDDAVARWNFRQQAPYNRLGFQAGLYGGGAQGGTRTSPVPGSASSPAAGAIGGGILGSQIPGAIVGTGVESALFGAGLPMTAAGLSAWPFALGGAILGGLLG